MEISALCKILSLSWKEKSVEYIGLCLPILKYAI